MPGTVGNTEVVEQAQPAPVETGTAVAVGYASTVSSDEVHEMFDEVYEDPPRRDVDRYSVNRVTRDLRRRKVNLERELAKTNAGLALLEADPRSIEVYRTIMEAY